MDGGRWNQDTLTNKGQLMKTAIDIKIPDSLKRYDSITEAAANGNLQALKRANANIQKMMNSIIRALGKYIEIRDESKNLEFAIKELEKSTTDEPGETGPPPVSDVYEGRAELAAGWNRLCAGCGCRKGGE